MRIVIVEDEAIAARGLERMVREILGKRLDSLRIERTLEGARTHLIDYPVDLVLLDLNLHGEDGFQVLSEFVAGAFQTIVVSANTGRALEAFEYGVIDFVPKPVSKERIERALARLGRGRENGTGARFLSVRRDEGTLLIPIESLVYVEGDDNDVVLHLADGAAERHRKTLDSLEKILPATFLRIHRSYIVDLRQIDHFRVRAGGKHDAVLRGGDVLPVGRSRYPEIRALVAGSRSDETGASSG